MKLTFIWPNCPFHNGEWNQPEIHSYWLECSRKDIDRHILPELNDKQKLRYEEIYKKYPEGFGFLVSGDLKSIWALPPQFPYSDHWEVNPFISIKELDPGNLNEIITIHYLMELMEEKNCIKFSKIKKKPFDKSYWVLPEQLLAGYYPGSMTKERTVEKLNALLDSGIRCIINLMEPDEYSTDNAPVIEYTEALLEIARERDIELKLYNFHVEDLSVPGKEQMKLILDVIDRNLYGENKRPVYVHCRGGIGRTGNVIGCWLKRHHFESENQSVLEVLYKIRSLQIPSQYLYDSPETEEQKNFVLNWEE